MTAENNSEDIIDLTLSSSDSESDETFKSEDLEDLECPFNPPINVSGNILSSRHYRILNSQSSWFTDDIINAFFCKLKDSATYLYVFCSFFYEALIQRGREYCLKHWLTANFKTFLASESSSLEDKLVLFPVNSGGSHWVLVIWEVSKGEIAYYDSLMCKRSGNLMMKHISGLINHFIDEDELDKSLRNLSLEDTKDEIIAELGLNIPKIKSLLIPKGQPQQIDGSSCGPFCCFFAQNLVKRKDLEGISVDINKFRHSLIDLFLNKNFE